MKHDVRKKTPEITKLIVEAAKKARKETSREAEPALTKPIHWPVDCNIGPGLEGAIACESRIGYVNGSKGWLIYRGYDIFDLCAHSCFEEVSYLLHHGKLPSKRQLEEHEKTLIEYRFVPNTVRHLLSFPVQEMNTMAALRIGCMMMRQVLSYQDRESSRPHPRTAIGTDEDSIPMETAPWGEEHAVYEFKPRKRRRPKDADETQDAGSDLQSCCRLVAGLPTLAAAIARVRQGKLPVEPDPELSHAGNLLYMMTGERPSPLHERIMDVALMLHADHGMNASTFAAMVVASTLSDVYFSAGAGIAALNGPLHGGANERVINVLKNEIGDAKHAKAWYRKARSRKRKIVGFGHRVYKAYDPRARVLGPLARHLARSNKAAAHLYKTARALEKEVVATLGKEKGIFPNVDFFSGIVYAAMGIPPSMFTPIFAVSRVVGWSARVLEYLENNRIFRPRAMYIGPLDKKYVPLSRR
jgi:citrate synthase